MKRREKIKQIYAKSGVKVGEDYIDGIIEDEERVKAFMRRYKEEEIHSINYIFGKPHDNKYFTKFELEAVSKVNLFNRKLVEACKKIHERAMEEGVANA